MTFDFDPWRNHRSKTWARKKAFKLNGYCYLQYIKPSRRWDALCSLRFEQNPTASRVWGLRKWFHNFLDHYEITRTTKHLVHLKRHDQPNHGYFDHVFSLNLGHIGSTSPDPNSLMWHHTWEPPRNWSRTHVIILVPKTSEDKQERPSHQQMEYVAQSFLRPIEGLPPRPHPTDETFYEYMSSIFTSPFVENRLQQGGDLKEYIDKLLEENQWWVPTTATLTRAQRQGVIRRLGMALQSTYELGSMLPKALRNYEEKVQEISTLENENKRIRRESTDATSQLVAERAAHEAAKETITLRTEELNLVKQHLADEIRSRDYALEREDAWMNAVTKAIGELPTHAYPASILEATNRLLEMSEQKTYLKAHVDFLDSEFARLLPDLRDPSHEFNWDWSKVSQHILELRQRADPSPYWDLLMTPPAQRTPHTPQEIANHIRTRVLEMLGTIWAELPADVISTPASPVTNIKESISRLKNKINRLSTSFTQLSNQQQQSPNMSQTGEPPVPPNDRTQAFHEVWFSLPAWMRQNEAGEEVGYTHDRLLTAINAIPDRCQHPAQLHAATTGHHDRMPENPTWDQMITHVRSHCSPPEEPDDHMSVVSAHTAASHHSHAPSVAVAAAPVWGGKFHGQLSEFNGDVEQFHEWSEELKNYATLNYDAPGRRFAALVITRLQGSARNWANEARTDRFSMVGGAPATAEETANAFVNAMWEEFADEGQQDRAATALRFLKQDTSKSMSEHINKFRDLTIKARIATNNPVVVEMFIGTLHFDVRQRVHEKRRDARRLTAPYQITDAYSDAQYYETLVKPEREYKARQKHNEGKKGQGLAVADTKASPAEASGGRSNWRPDCNHEDIEGCPRALQGYLGERGTDIGEWKRNWLAQIGRCLKCRGKLAPGEQGYVATPPTVPALPQGLEQPRRGRRGQ